MAWLPWELRVTSDRTTILMPRNYKTLRIMEVIRQYRVTHILWGSFEPPPFDEINPESWSDELDKLHTVLRLTEKREVYRTTSELFFPVRLYSLSVVDASVRRRARGSNDGAKALRGGTRMRWSRAVLVMLLLLRRVVPRRIRLRPVLRDKVRVNLWPGAVGASEPLDCDEAAYAYIGHRILRGDVLYRDVTENKTPLGYWLYTLAVAVGGYNELAIRIMPIPFVLATIAIVWWIAGRLAGPLAACLAAALYILLSTDPFLFGNGSNLEHFINFFSVASLAILIRAWRDTRRWPLCAAGACLTAAALVKQIAIFPVLVYGPALLLGTRMACRFAARKTPRQNS